MSFAPLHFAHLFRGSFRQGIHPPENKHATALRPIERLPFPPELILPLSMHVGNPSKSRVRKGQEVVRGEPIAEADGFMSVPLHAPATGVVKDIRPMPSARGPLVESIVLEVYPGDPQESDTAQRWMSITSCRPRFRRPFRMPDWWAWVVRLFRPM
jgi:electron transport complex protein RnfC